MILVSKILHRLGYWKAFTGTLMSDFGTRQIYDEGIKVVYCFSPLMYTPLPLWLVLSFLDPQNGPNWPKYAPFTFPKGVLNICGRNHFSQLLGQNWPFLGHAKNGPQRAQMAPKKAEVGL